MRMENFKMQCLYREMNGTEHEILFKLESGIPYLWDADRKEWERILSAEFNHIKEFDDQEQHFYFARMNAEGRGE